LYYGCSLTNETITSRLLGVVFTPAPYHASASALFGYQPEFDIGERGIRNAARGLSDSRCRSSAC
jgi:hypothetical protein